MIVFCMGLEMLGQVVDPFTEDRDLDFGRAGIALLGGKGLDDLRLTVGCNRHRHLPSHMRAPPWMPARLKTRLGTISPRSTSARAINCPDAVTWTVPRKMGASRPRNKTA